MIFYLNGHFKARLLPIVPGAVCYFSQASEYFFQQGPQTRALLQEVDDNEAGELMVTLELNIG